MCLKLKKIQLYIRLVVPSCSLSSHQVALFNECFGQLTPDYSPRECQDQLVWLHSSHFTLHPTTSEKHFLASVGCSNSCPAGLSRYVYVSHKRVWAEKTMHPTSTGRFSGMPFILLLIYLFFYHFSPALIRHTIDVLNGPTCTIVSYKCWLICEIFI